MKTLVLASCLICLAGCGGTRIHLEEIDSGKPLTGIIVRNQPPMTLLPTQIERSWTNSKGDCLVSPHGPHFRVLRFRWKGEEYMTMLPLSDITAEGREDVTLLAPESGPPQKVRMTVKAARQ